MDVHVRVNPHVWVACGGQKRVSAGVDGASEPPLGTEN